MVMTCKGEIKDTLRVYAADIVKNDWSISRIHRISSWYVLLGKKIGSNLLVF